MNKPHKNTAAIVPLQRDHMDQVILLLQNISSFTPPKELHDEIWDTFKSQLNVHSVVAIEDDLVVGYGSIVIESKIRGGKMGHIEDIATHSEKRNTGIGKIIVNALYDIAHANGCYKVTLQCQQHNISFYEKCEYSVSGTAMQRFIK